MVMVLMATDLARGLRAGWPTSMDAALFRTPTVRMAAVSESGLPQKLQRGMLAVASTPFLEHEASLPLLSRRLISERARLIFLFVIEYLAESGIDAEVHASGGYVRDLLLGKISDDLDLSLRLARCDPELTITEVASGMPEFAASRPDLAVDGVAVISALSDTARDKGIDAAQLCMTIDGVSLNIDLMPTVGAETYGDMPIRRSWFERGRLNLRAGEEPFLRDRREVTG